MKTSAKNYLDMESGDYVEPGHDVVPEPMNHLQQQIAELTDAIERLQKRVEELERREPW